jgi:anti-sigma regulatory factor (Ser/Thr protein kinase)
MCPYDRSTLEAGVLHESCRSHPVVLDGPVRRPSPSFAGVQAALEPFALPLPAPTGRTTPLGFDATTVHAVRGAVARRAGVAGLTTPRTRDLQLATHEAATNSVWHGGGRGVLRTWLEDDRLVCEVRDRGHVDDPLAGRHLPDRDQLGGRGLYIANQLCDLVQLRSSAQGTVVRLHMDLAA